MSGHPGEGPHMHAPDGEPCCQGALSLACWTPTKVWQDLLGCARCWLQRARQNYFATAASLCSPIVLRAAEAAAAEAGAGGGIGGALKKARVWGAGSGVVGLCCICCSSSSLLQDPSSHFSGKAGGGGTLWAGGRRATSLRLDLHSCKHPTNFATLHPLLSLSLCTPAPLALAGLARVQGDHAR